MAHRPGLITSLQPSYKDWAAGLRRASVSFGKSLEFQANRIEAVLALHKVEARVTVGTVSPRWVHFQVLSAVEARISRIKNLSEELAAALDAANCRVSRRGAAVAVEVPRDDPQPVRLLPLYEQLAHGPHLKAQDPKSKAQGLAIPAVTAIPGLAEGRVTRFQVAHVSPAEIREVVGNLRLWQRSEKYDNE